MTLTGSLRKSVLALLAGLACMVAAAIVLLQESLLAHLWPALLFLVTASGLSVFAWSIQRRHASSLEQDVSRTLERNRQIMSTINDVVFRADFFGRLVYVNEAWL